MAVYWVNTTVNIGKDNPKPWAFAIELDCADLAAAEGVLKAQQCLRGNKLDVRDDGNGRRVVTSRRPVILGVRGIVSLQDYGYDIVG